MSVWLDVQFDEGNDTIGWFDHDYVESGGAGLTGPPEPLATLFDGSSRAEAWAAPAIAAAARLSITTATCVWILYDHIYDAPRGPLVRKAVPAKDDDTVEVGNGAVFLGTFPAVCG